MDCQMPKLDGFEATAMIREASIRVPIIALIANTSSRDRQRATQSGMDDFLSKPFKLEDIQNKISDWA